MSEQDLDRNEAATPFKLEKARDRGQTARSTEVVAAAVLTVAVIYLCWHGVAAMRELVGLCRSLFVAIAQADAAQRAPWQLVSQMVSGGIAFLLPLFILVMAAAIAATVGQTGVVLSMEPLAIDMSRIHPATGFKRIFSMRSLFELARACIKMLVLGLTAWFALRALLPQFHRIQGLEPGPFLQLLVEDAGALGTKLVIALAVLALIDLAYTRAEFGRRMRMSRRELKEEHKNREGDPRIRSRLRELRREMLKRSMALSNTRTADVVLTNPTHYAVALRYVHGEMDAPRVVAKGAGQLAAVMREIAARHRVVVVQNPPLARRLFHEAALQESLPGYFHVEVARIIVWVFAMRERRQAGVVA
ncbi:EscU/YscU/HrcU family type III secretion system export apparatus switch protein [Ramlibacter sp. PS3R-8]|uniref:EscU/YscU/HrcU family type III secretion system export apparatus switch protein n=1 Tax=Ramlibacter sp. PS3R-8 TaxID=3133437 RepID=UPI0030B53028